MMEEYGAAHCSLVMSKIDDSDDPSRIPNPILHDLFSCPDSYFLALFQTGLWPPAERGPGVHAQRALALLAHIVAA